MSGITDLIDLPQQLQIALAAGFIGYLVAFAGVRIRHSQTEMVFYTVVFSVIASALLNAFARYWTQVWPWGATGAAALSTMIAIALTGYAWQRFRPKVFRCLRWAGLAQHDGTGSVRVLDGIINDPKLHWKQLQVTLTDGSSLICENTGELEGAAMGFARVDGEGNIAMIATHREKANGEREELDDVLHPIGDQYTYIPSGQIRYIVVRLKGGWSV